MQNLCLLQAKQLWRQELFSLCRGSLPRAADAAVFAVVVKHRLQVDGQGLDDRRHVLLQLLADDVRQRQALVVGLAQLVPDPQDLRRT